MRCITACLSNDPQYIIANFPRHASTASISCATTIHCSFHWDPWRFRGLMHVRRCCNHATGTLDNACTAETAWHQIFRSHVIIPSFGSELQSMLLCMFGQSKLRMSHCPAESIQACMTWDAPLQGKGKLASQCAHAAVGQYKKCHKRKDPNLRRWVSH